MHELDCADHGSAFLTYITGKLPFWGASLFFSYFFYHFPKIFFPVRFTKPNTRSYNKDIEIGDDFYV
jgi:hypothetical protein